MSAETTKLAEAVEQLYATFDRYRPRKMYGCPCCTSDAEGERLVSTPLRSLTADNLSRYAFKAVSTWGTVEDFKHFLPRILELTAAGDFRRTVDPEVILEKPGYAEWTSWTARERAAVETFYRSLWRDLLSTYPHPLAADECLCGIGGTMTDLRPYLSDWEADDRRAAAMHFADFVQQNLPRSFKKKPRLSNAFWGGRPVQAGQVWAWLLDPAWIAAVERGFFRYADDEAAGRLSEAFNHLRTLQAQADASTRSEEASNDDEPDA